MKINAVIKNINLKAFSKRETLKVILSLMENRFHKGGYRHER